MTWAGIGGGAAAVVTFHSHEDDARRTVAGIEEHGGRAVAAGADEGGVKRLYDEPASASGSIDLLVADSEIQEEAATADGTAVFGADVTGHCLRCRDAIRHVRGQDAAALPARAAGAIGSMHQRIFQAEHANYTASEGASA